MPWGKSIFKPRYAPPMLSVCVSVCVLTVLPVVQFPHAHHDALVQAQARATAAASKAKMELQRLRRALAASNVIIGKTNNHNMYSEMELAGDSTMYDFDDVDAEEEEVEGPFDIAEREMHERVAAAGAGEAGKDDVDNAEEKDNDEEEEEDEEE